MHINNILNFGLTTATWGIVSVLWVEIVRDIYHVLAHRWSWLYQHHVWHHQAFHPNLKLVSEQIYRKSQWHHDIPEAFVMLFFSLLFFGLSYSCSSNWKDLCVLPGGLLGSIYAFRDLIFAGLRSCFTWAKVTDSTHNPELFCSPPSKWLVNRTYHFRHHFENPQAYYCATYTFLDQIMGTALSLKGKTIAITDASDNLGKALLDNLTQAGAKVIVLTVSKEQPVTLTVEHEEQVLKTISGNIRQEADLGDILERVDVLVFNHTLNKYQQKIENFSDKSGEFNSVYRYYLLELFLATIRNNIAVAKKEAWIILSEANNKLSQNSLSIFNQPNFGELVTGKKLDAPCIIRKIFLIPILSKNPSKLMSANWVAQQIINAVTRDTRNIIVPHKSLVRS